VAVGAAAAVFRLQLFAPWKGLQYNLNKAAGGACSGLLAAGLSCLAAHSKELLAGLLRLAAAAAAGTDGCSSEPVSLLKLEGLSPHNSYVASGVVTLQPPEVRETVRGSSWPGQAVSCQLSQFCLGNYFENAGCAVQARMLSCEWLPALSLPCDARVHSEAC
jgi:hypothetical protein